MDSSTQEESIESEPEENENLAPRLPTTYDQELVSLRQTISYHEPRWNIFTIVSTGILILVCLFYFMSDDLSYKDYKKRVTDRKEGYQYEQLEQELLYLDQEIQDRRGNLSKFKQASKLSGNYEHAEINQTKLSFAKKLLSLVDHFPPQNFSLASAQRSMYLQKYKTDQYPEYPFCIVVPTFNNIPQNRHLRNIRSIVQQQYQNYHIVIIDDASTDDTGEEILKFLKEESGLNKEKFTVIKNKERMFAMANLKRAASEMCKKDDIFLIVDGDDELIGKHVLKVFNAVFHKEQSWFVYSNSMQTSTGKSGYSRPIPSPILEQNNIRRYPFVTSHLRAFYTQLFLNIEEEDLKDENGEYIKAANDVAICIPAIQQSGTKVTYIPEVLYAYNGNTGLNNHQTKKREQLMNAILIRRKKKYTPLKNLI